MSNTAANFAQFPGPLGPKCDAPINAFYADRDPTPFDIHASILDEWINTNTNIVWQLFSLDGDVPANTSQQIYYADWRVVAVGNPDLLTLTADDAAVAVPDGAGTIFIRGQPGVLTTSGATANTIYVNFIGNGPANAFVTNAGTANPVAGVLNVFGGSNIGTTGAGQNLTINLDPSITLTGSVSVGTTLSVLGTASFAGNVFAFGNLSVSGTAFINNLTVTGPIDTALPRGVVQSSATGALSSSEGTDGQILISSSTGPVAWANITAPTGSIDITVGPNTIDLELGGEGAFDPYQLFYWNPATSNLTTTVGGLAGQVMTSRGPGLSPVWDTGGGGGGTVGSLEGNSGGPVSPTVGGVINVIGDGVVTNVVGDDPSSTLTIALLSSGVAGQILRSTATVANSPVYSTAAYPATTTLGSILYSPTANDITGLAFDNTATRYLSNTGVGGTLPAWAEVDLVQGVTGVLPIANGGTNIDGAAYITNGTFYFNGTEFVTVAPGTATDVLTSQGAGLPPIFAPGGGGAGTGATTFLTDNTTAVVNVNTISILGDGVNIDTNGLTANTVRVVLRDTIHLPVTNTGGTAGIIFLGADRFMHDYASTGLPGNNTFLGRVAGSLTSVAAVDNTGIGAASMSILTTGSLNTAVGSGALQSLEDGAENTALGVTALNNVDSGSNNTAVGYNAGEFIANGNFNTCIGSNAGQVLTTTSNNIMLGHPGIITDSGVMRLGTTGVGGGQQSTAFLAATRGVAVGGIGVTAHLVGINAAEQLGDFTLTSTGATVAITYPTSSTINLEAGAAAAATFGTDAGAPNPVSPTAGLLDILGGANISTTASSPAGQGTITISVAGTTNHAVQVGNVSGALTSLAVPTNGQVLIGVTTADPSWITPTAGTGLTLVANATTLSWGLTVPVAIANGGTNSTVTPPTNAVMYFDGTRYVGLTNGTTGQTLTATTAAAPTWTTLAAGGVTSVAGTANQVTASPTTGAVVVSLPTTVIGPGSVASTTTLGAGTNLLLPQTTAAVGQVIMGGLIFAHAMGTNNAFFGQLAGNTTLTTAAQNVGVGYRSASALTAGLRNTAVGYFSLLGKTSGSDNTAIGANALSLSATNNRNTVVGSQAGVNTDSSDNTFVGYISAGNNTSGAQNTFVGSFSGTTNTTGASNTYIGYSAGSGGGAGTGDSNTFVGANSGSAVATGSELVAIGAAALNATTDATQTVAIGHGAGGALTTGAQNNVIVGGSSVPTATSACPRNVVIGYNSATAWTTGSNDNIYIGSNIPGAAGEANTIRIGLGTGTGTSNVSRCFIQGIQGVTVTSSAAVLINTTTGQLGTVVSSRRYKESIVPMTGSNVLDLTPVRFTYKETKERSWGLIAEEVAEKMPELVIYKDGLPETVAYHLLPVLLLKELQKQATMIKLLEEKIIGLSGRL